MGRKGLKRTQRAREITKKYELEREREGSFIVLWYVLITPAVSHTHTVTSETALLRSSKTE